VNEYKAVELTESHMLWTLCYMYILTVPYVNVVTFPMIYIQSAIRDVNCKLYGIKLTDNFCLLNFLLLATGRLSMVTLARH
jgi:hypothetical protein